MGFGDYLPVLVVVVHVLNELVVVDFVEVAFIDVFLQE